MSEKPDVLVTRSFNPKALSRLREQCRVRVWPGELPPSRQELLGEIARAQGVLTLLTDTVDGEVMDAAPHLKVISNMAVGYDNIDIAAASARGIAVGNTPGVLTESTADLAFALLLASARRIPEASRYVREDRWKTWSPDLLLGRDIHGATLGIVGMGRIGRAVARRARGFGMRVLYHGGGESEAVEALGAQACSLSSLLADSDYVSLHCRLTKATHHLIDERTLSLMKPHAILVNTARGPLVKSEALYRALKEGHIGGAALDVTEPEPLPGDHPLVQLDNCLVAPHIGSATVTTRERMAMIATDNLLAGLLGKPLPHCVNPEHLKSLR